jgi:hypothetical protein
VMKVVSVKPPGGEPTVVFPGIIAATPKLTGRTIYNPKIAKPRAIATHSSQRLRLHLWLRADGSNLGCYPPRDTTRLS